MLELEYLVGLLGGQVLRHELLELRLYVGDPGPGKLKLVEGHTGLLKVPAGQDVSGDKCNPRYLSLIHVITQRDTQYISTSRDNQ